ncbi:ribokinase [Roseicitreum antarcticum]|uniref:Ribokinase n=1 Tax=Roseicitreum antarcticum TaxID=564137 RepID=A0A1H2QXJ3_9RHOB|nr:ribokinase [Roseicitreum antarcticum]SDW11159.1 ribokinase [Roseicitreum antarcticum]
MAIYNFGSINIDHVYRVAHLPAPGETVHTLGYQTGLGGKGANQSIAAALAGARVVHIGAVGADGTPALDRLSAAGVETSAILRMDNATGHAIVMVDQAAENAIALHGGANAEQGFAHIEAALEDSVIGDTLMMQNETLHQADAARVASGLGLEVVYSAAPFDIDAVRAVLPYVTLLILNEGEAAQLCSALGVEIPDLPVDTVVVTRGAKGAECWQTGEAPLLVPAHAVVAVDTTGAGDCFAGSLVAALDRGDDLAGAMRYASAAAALQVMRPGAADAMPTRVEVESLL